MKGQAKVETQEQFVLRMRKGTPLDTILRTALETGRAYTKDEIVELGGQTQWRWNYAWVMKFFDNVSVTMVDGGKYKSSYFELQPSVPTPVSVSVQMDKPARQVLVDEDEESTFLASSIGMPQADFNNVKWPECPPMVEGQDWFKEPSWYKTMRAMVRLGKHIALSGPPGVGKDTAVIELAAQEGHPLITIGGDAGFRRRDLVGQTHINNGSSYIEVGEYAAAVVNGWWVLLTEVNAADADALMFINAQLAAPYIVSVAGKAYPVHPDFRLFISYNPGLVGTKPLPQSFKDRFYSIQVPFFTEPFLKGLLEAHGMPVSNMPWPRVIVAYGMAMWKAYEMGQMKYQVTSRRLIDAVDLMVNGLEDTIMDALKHAVIAAIDSPMDAKVAERVLTEVCNQSRY
jgi:hypothetical protein